MPDPGLEYRIREAEDQLVVELDGVLDSGTAPDLAAKFGELPVNGHPRVVLDLTRVSRIDSAGVAVILDAREELAGQGVKLSLRGATAQVRKVFAISLARADELSADAPDQFWDPITAAGQAVARGWHRSGEVLRQFGEVIYWLLVAPFRGQWPRFDATAEQINRFGASAIPIVGLIALLIGLIMAMQSAHQLRQFGAVIFVADLVGISVCRELGPFVTAIVVAGRSGSAVAAELGTMTVSEEIDALRTMGLNPMRYLVVPRILAMTICTPLLTILANLIAILGGMLIGIFHLGISASAYMNETIQAVSMSDLASGLVKSVIFGAVIGNVGVFEGLHVHGGSEGVGTATTQAVVSAIFLIIVTDAIFTALFYFL
ncbi:MAG TPA: MlaE family lipid ABC transporter permease subunit [Candidatus Udaeobacter sp.]|nr:MlaE family lipid ABC transporter permease subunit [Candidatus Udaeobacter sp.]